MPRKLLVGLVLLAVFRVAAAEEHVLPIFALGWPGRDGNRWTSEVFLTNVGPSTVHVRNARFLPGTLKVGVPCLPPVPAFHDVPPYTTVMLSSSELSQELECPQAALGGLAFDADGPVRIGSRVVNVRDGAAAAPALSGLGQEIPAFGPAELAVAGGVYQLPALLWDPYRCNRAPLFDIYLYLVNPGADPVDVTLQQARDWHAGDLVINGVSVPTPHTFTLEAREWRQLKVELGGAIPAVCLPPQVVDLFFTATGGVAVVAAVVDRGSQDPRTVLPLRTSD